MASLSGLGTAGNVNPNKSYEVVPAPNDSISSLSFNPRGNFLVATSWDNEVRCWEIQGGVSQAKASITHDHPVLCSTWKDDSTVFSGGCDKIIKMWPLGAQPTVVAAHDAPIKEVAWVQQKGCLVTGSWDKTLRYITSWYVTILEMWNFWNDHVCSTSFIILVRSSVLFSHLALPNRYWDLRQQQPSLTVQLPERCYALGVNYPLMVVGTADRNLVVFHLDHPQTEYKRIQSPLKYQTRCVAAFPDQQGFLVGSIEGRVGVHHLAEDQQAKNFTFKCHREGNEIYAVNSLNFHPVHHTFATSGSDGAFNFWDKDSKQRLKAMSRCSNPIPCSTFNHDGSLFAYAVSYDWSKGAENHNPATAKSYIYLHSPQEAEVKAKPRIGSGGRK